MNRSTLFAALCVLATLAMMPTGHTLVRLLQAIDDPWVQAYSNIAVGMLGFACVWLGLRKSELQACVLGFFGANLMFAGFFSYRITKIKVPGAILRYAIPVGVLYWAWVETMASMDIVYEYYLHPFDYPLACAATVALAFVLLIVVYQGRLSRS